jgi:molybdopterin synthase catalytic subunit
VDIATPRDVRLLEKGFSAGQALAAFARTHPLAGGIASFAGQVRPDAGVEMLELSHYAPLTERGMVALADRALARWELHGLLAWHRIGAMLPGATIVLVAAAARHRRAAIEAVDFTMDHLKSEAWLWKREKRADGWHWVEPRDQDRVDLARWKMTLRF